MNSLEMCSADLRSRHSPVRKTSLQDARSMLLDPNDLLIKSEPIEDYSDVETLPMMHVSLENIKEESIDIKIEWEMDPLDLEDNNSLSLVGNLSGTAADNNVQLGQALKPEPTSINSNPKHKHQCSECIKAFRSHYELTMHQRIHTGEKPYQCDYCNKAFSRTGNLVKHKKLHTGEKPYKCDYCNKSYTTNRILSLHRRKHTGERPYQCDQCKKTFTRNDALNMHMRTHTGEKPSKCDQCDKRFGNNSKLTLHKKTHTGKKSHQCDQCGKTYANKGNLIMHQRAHARKKKFKCDIVTRNM